MNKKLALLTVMMFALGFLFASCAALKPKPTAANFKAPVVKLSSIELPYYEGFWYYGKAKPVMGTAPAGGGSSPVVLDFIFDITNPNDFPVRLDTARFFLFFDNYELRVVNDENPMWIPAGKTNSKVLNVTLTPFSTFVKFLLASKQEAIKRGDKPWDKIKEWWTELPDMSFPIDVKQGAFDFSADGLVKVVPVEQRYHP